MSEKPQTNKIISSLRKWIGGFSLQTQTWFVATISVGSAAAVLSILSFVTLGHSFRKIEDQAVNEGSQRLSRALAFSVDGLVRMARDYATWITTYEFVQKPNQDYRDTNFSASVGSNLQLAGFMVFNREG